MLMVFFGFPKPDLSPREYMDRCFPVVALCHLIVRRQNLEVATKKFFYQQLNILG